MMIKRLALISIMLVISQGIYAGEKYPQDVSQFIEKRDQCDYLSGEISGEPEIDNARNLNEQLDKYCKGTDQLLTTLKLKYKENKSILKKLDTYELIEFTNNCSNDLE